MMGVEPEVARSRWLSERPLYEQFGDIVMARLEKATAPTGVWHRISGRVKDVDSLVRNAIKGYYKSYEAIADRFGARVVVRFPQDVEKVTSVVTAVFNALEIERKSEKLEPNELGYQSCHIDVALREDDPDYSVFRHQKAEIQVRTLSQDLWSELAHELSYKPAITIGRALERRIYILGGLIESADMEFTRINDEINSLPQANVMRLLRTLESYYFQLTARRYDNELSLDVIAMLLPLYEEPPDTLPAEFERFFLKNKETLQFIFQKQEKLPETRSVFLFQPESLMIFERLQSDQLRLEKFWETRLPIKELERMAVLWGRPLD